MGANSQQGWNLLLFLIGFVFLPAGLVYLGPVFALIGLGFLIASAIGFRRIKPLENPVVEKTLRVAQPQGASAKQHAVS